MLAPAIESISRKHHLFEQYFHRKFYTRYRYVIVQLCRMIQRDFVSHRKRRRTIVIYARAFMALLLRIYDRWNHWLFAEELRSSESEILPWYFCEINICSSCILRRTRNFSTETFIFLYKPSNFFAFCFWLMNSCQMINTSARDLLSRKKT